MVRLSELFAVSTDYLLKDDLEEADPQVSPDAYSTVRRVTMEEANAFLAAKAETAKTIAVATFLCVLSPITLIILSAMSESPSYALEENVAGGVGVIVLLLFVILAVVLFISSGRKTATYNFLGEEYFETAYGVSGMVADRKSQYNATHTRNNIIGTCLCIMAFIPIFGGIIIDEENDLLMVSMVSLAFVMVGAGLIFFISSGIVWASYEKLLQEGDYSKEKKGNQSLTSAVYTTYWLLVTATYLGYSFLTGNWGYSWIIWVVASIVFPALVVLMGLLAKRNQKK